MVTAVNSLWEIAASVNLYNLSRTSQRSIQTCATFKPYNQNTVHFYAPKKNRHTLILATTDGNGPPTSQPNLSDQTNTEENQQDNDENAPPKRAPLTARERLRAARVLSKYTESNSKKPSRSEFGSKVLDVIKEADKGKRKGSRLPDAPDNLFDDSNRGLPKDKWTINLPFGNDLLAVVFSFVFITTVMLGTTYLVWKVGAIHFNED